ncbi:MAG: TraB/GumN family protein [Candidatus Poseidoniaceae archaeon]|jgi:pheromone shutdown-related protein TraB
MITSPFIDISPNLRILGTAHVATASVEAVRHHIAEYQPDIVAVELCKSRHEALTSDRRLDKEGLLKVVKEGKAPLVLIQSLLAAEQRKLGLDEGQQPGAELIAAVEEAKAAGLEVALVDRDIQVTLRRAWKNMRFIEKFRVLKSLLGQDDEEEVPDVNTLLDDSDLLSSLMEELRGFSPGAGKVLIDERDEYLATKISALNTEKKVLAVVGAGHLAGIKEYLVENKCDINRIQQLQNLPRKTFAMKVMPWAVPMLLMGLMAYYLSTGTDIDLVQFFTVWTAANAIFAAIGCIIARGHPLAILTAALASPITSLNPALAAGWFAGYVQLKMAEPSAEDLADFLKLDNLGMFWSNKAGRVLLVTALTNLGSMSGAWVAAAGLLGGFGL